MTAVTVIIPVYNEADILEGNCRTLHALLSQERISFEILLGSNGSTDDTDRIGQRLAEEDPRIGFFKHPKRGAVGRIFSQAVAGARYEKLISLDIDLTIDLGFIPEALELLETHDLVIGSKKAGKESRTWIRRLGSDLYIRVVKNLLDLTYSDYSIGAKAFRRSAILPFVNNLESGTGYIFSLISRLQRNGAHIIQVPVDCSDLRGSRFNLLKEGLYRFFHLFCVWLFQDAPYPNP